MWTNFSSAHGFELTPVVVLMTDPAVPFLPNSGYGPYERGHALDVFLKAKNGSESLGVVWPGLKVLLTFLTFNSN